MKNSHGGWRSGAGRPNLTGKVNHMKRPHLRGLCSLHLKFQLQSGLNDLRRQKNLRHLLRSLKASERFGWKVNGIGVRQKEIEILCTAKSNRDVSRSVQSFSIRFAKSINAQLNRTGSVFHGRYSLRVIRDRRSITRLRKRMNSSLKELLIKVFKKRLPRIAFSHPLKSLEQFLSFKSVQTI